MKTTLLILLLSFVALLAPAKAQHEDQIVSKILQDEWVMRYKKLKTDLENKASNLKEMEGLSEKDLSAIRKSYTEISARLNLWLENFLKSCQEPETIKNLQHSASPVNDFLKQDLMAITAMYENTFHSQYEEITGKRDRYFLYNSIQANTGSNEYIATNNIDYSRVEGEQVSKRIRKPLSVANWKEL